MHFYDGQRTLLCISRLCHKNILSVQTTMSLPLPEDDVWLQNQEFLWKHCRFSSLPNCPHTCILVQTWWSLHGTPHSGAGTKCVWRVRQEEEKSISSPPDPTWLKSKKSTILSQRVLGKADYAMNTLILLQDKSLTGISQISCNYCVSFDLGRRVRLQRILDLLALNSTLAPILRKSG